jgi:hypothetical protein
MAYKANCHLNMGKSGICPVGSIGNAKFRHRKDALEMVFSAEAKHKYTRMWEIQKAPAGKSRGSINWANQIDLTSLLKKGCLNFETAFCII